MITANKRTKNFILSEVGCTHFLWSMYYCNWFADAHRWS